MTGERGEPSQHPIDALIRDIITTGGQPTSEEVAQIVWRMAEAPFNDEIVIVQAKYRGLAYQGIVLGRYRDSFTFHFMRRIVVDEQWVIRTTQPEFLSDIRRVPLEPNARLLAYNRWGQNFVAAVGSTVDVVPSERLGPGAEGVDLARVLSRHGSYPNRPHVLWVRNVEHTTERAMDQVRDVTTTERIEHLLHYLTIEWESVTEAAEEWETWGRATRDTLRLDWPVVESKLERLHSFADRDLLNAEQQTRYNELLTLIERQRPVLDSLTAE